jgi:hypothetical protein
MENIDRPNIQANCDNDRKLFGDLFDKKKAKNKNGEPIQESGSGNEEKLEYFTE